MSQEYPNLTKALDLADTGEVDDSIVDLIDRDTAVASLVDGLVGAVLECVGMATMVATTQVAAGQASPIDASKVQLGRVKMVEGLLEIIEAGDTSLIIDDHVDISEDGSLSTIGVLKEFIAQTKAKLAEASANEQPE